MEPRYTYDDYARLPEGAPYQLIDGYLVKHPSPTPYHQRLSGRLESLLREYVRERDLGEVLDAPLDVYLEEAQTFQPDIIFISNERRELIGQKKIEGAPDLVVEILSPSTARYDLHEKKRAYEKAGVLEYWIVDPRWNRVEVYGATESGFRLLAQETGTGAARSGLLPGFTVDLAELFA